MTGLSALVVLFLCFCLMMLSIQAQAQDIDLKRQMEELMNQKETLTKFVDYTQTQLWGLKDTESRTEAASTALSYALSNPDFVSSLDPQTIEKQKIKVEKQNIVVKAIGDELNLHLAVSKYALAKIDANIKEVAKKYFTGITRVSFSGFATFVIKHDSTITMFGSNNGRISGSDAVATDTAQYSPFFVDRSGVLKGKVIQKLVCGYYHCLALTTDNKLVAWGDNTYGQLGTGDELNRYYPDYVDVAAMNGKKIINIQASYYASYATTEDNVVYSFGRNNVAQLCDPLVSVGSSSFRRNPFPVPTPFPTSSVSAVFLGMDITFWGLNDGTVYGCGNNAYKQVDSSAINRVTPVLLDFTNVNASDPWVQVEGSLSVFGLTKSGKVYAWGFGNGGQMGDGKSSYNAAPTLMTYFSNNGIVIKKICNAWKHVVALSNRGVVFFWGQLTNDSVFGPVYTVPSGFSELNGYVAVDIACHFSAVAVTLENGEIFTFGVNIGGRLGDGTTIDRLSTPAKATLYSM